MSAFRMPKQGITFETVALRLGKMLGKGGKCSPAELTAHSRLRHFHRKPTEKSFDRFFQDLAAVGESVSANRHLPSSIRTELRPFLTAWEHLLQHGLPTDGSNAKIRWAMATRFIVPWAAMRLALYQRRKGELPRWLKTRLKNAGTGSCFSFWVDEQRRQTTSSLAKWLENTSGHSSFGVDSLRRAIGESQARRCALSSFIVGGFLAAYHCQPHVCQEMILANAIDHALLGSEREFSQDWADHLLGFFSVCLERFSLILSAHDLPTSETKALQWLSSPTISGNTPFDAEWLHPVVGDPYLHELARKVAQDVSLAGGGAGLGELPLKPEDKATWPLLTPLNLPAQLERAVGSCDPMQVVNLSKLLFSKSRGRLKEMTLVSRWLVALLRRFSGRLHDSAKEQGWQEADRLMQLALQRSMRGHRPAHALSLLRHLLQPDRTWQDCDAAEVRSLLKELRPEHGKHGRIGRQHYLEGCFWLRLNDRKTAVAAFEQALKCGHASVGSDGCSLPRDGLRASQGVSRRAEKRFRKLARIEGLVGSSRSPKTRAFMRGLRSGRGD